MANRTIPTRDVDLLAFSSNFSALLLASGGALGITPTQAAGYAALHASYAASLAAVEPGVRSKAGVAVKNAHRSALKNGLRPLVSIIRGQAAVTAAQQIELGLVVRGQGGQGGHAGPPVEAPRLEVVSVSGFAARIRLRDASAAGRTGKPAGVIGASVFSFVGASALADRAGWKFEGNTGRTAMEVAFPTNLAPGATVWFTAFWFDNRKQSGPACPPVGTNLPGGSVARAA